MGKGLFYSALSLVRMGSFNGVFAREADAGLALAGSDSGQADQADDTKDDELSRVMADSVRSMFQEKETPLLHIRWGTKIYFDVPIGNEPEGSSPTLRKAGLKLSRAFGKNFQVKLSGNCTDGEFKAGDSYLVYTGWKAAILTAGVQSPPFSQFLTNDSRNCDQGSGTVINVVPNSPVGRGGRGGVPRVSW